MIQSGVLRIFRMAVRGVCSLSALPVCFACLLRLSACSVCSVCSVLFCPVLSCSVRSSIRPFVHSFGCFASCPSVPSVLSARPTVRLSVCPFVRLFRLLFICSVCSSIRLLCLSVSPLIRPRPLCPLRPLRPLRPLCPLRPPAPPVPLRSRRILFRRFRTVLCFFSSQDVFSHPISDTLLKSRRGELGISDNN